MAKRTTNHPEHSRKGPEAKSDPHVQAALAMTSWTTAYQARYRSSRLDEPMGHDAPEVHLGWAAQRGVGELLLRATCLGHRQGVGAAMIYGASPTTPVRGVVPLQEAVISRDVAIIADMLGWCTTYEQRLTAVLFLFGPSEPRRMLSAPG